VIGLVVFLVHNIQTQKNKFIAPNQWQNIQLTWIFFQTGKITRTQGYSLAGIGTAEIYFLGKNYSK
jgi:hypothetical protein